MFKNLLVNGCSYTQELSWAQFVSNYYTPDVYKNLARGGAGNSYIANSTIDYLESSNLKPDDTMVIIMWSGTGRKDLRVSGEWYYYLKDQYNYCACSSNGDESEYYVFSGGLTNSWKNNAELKKMFEWAYKVSDPVSLCKDSLIEFIKVETYLKYHGYQYRMASFLNYWSPTDSCAPISGDYSIPYFLKDITMYKNYSMDSWIFADAHKTCLGEYAKNLGELDSTGHPTQYAHQMFAENIIIPRLN